MTGPDENIALALRAFALQVQKATEASDLNPSSNRISEEGRQQLLQIAKGIEALAEHSETASYQAFVRLLRKAERAGATIPSNTVFTVGRAFIDRLYVRPSG